MALASSHAPPRAGRERRPEEAGRVVQLLRGCELVLLGQDRNSVGADKLADGSFYDPDPYQPEPATPGLWTTDNPPETAFPTDRTPGAILTVGGLIDIAPHLRAPWKATTGHWPGERNGYRRIDEIRANEAMARRAASYTVVDIGAARQASDHLPIGARFNMA